LEARDKGEGLPTSNARQEEERERGDDNTV